MSRIITIGEPLAEFITQETGAPAVGDRYALNVDGAELCYALAMRRLGYDVQYVGKVGGDAMGQFVKSWIQSQGVDISYLYTLAEAPTGLLVKGQNANGWPDWDYYRVGSAGTYLNKFDIDRVDFSNIDHMHVTGIACSLSQSAREAVMEMIHQAHQHDITVSFDPNIRPKMWCNQTEACKVINGISLLCDIIFPEYEEGVKLLGITDPDEMADFYLSAGVKTVVIKSLERGIFVKNKRVRFWADPYDLPDNPTDLMGLGEGFVAGVTSAILEGRNLMQAVERGRVIASNVANYNTAYEGLPTREELAVLVEDIKRRSEDTFTQKHLIVPPKDLDPEWNAQMKAHAHAQFAPKIVEDEDV